MTEMDASWAKHGLELVGKLREDLKTVDWRNPREKLPTAYLCGADVPGLVAYVDSLLEKAKAKT